MSKRGNGEGTWSKVKIHENDYYMYRIIIDNKRKSFYGKTKKEALEKYKSYSETSQIDTDLQDLTFYSYAHKWLTNFKKDKIKPKTYDYYDFTIETFIKDTPLGTSTIKRLNSLTNKECRRLFQNHINKFLDKSKSTLDGIHTVLLQVCKYGVEYEDFSHNFMIGIEKIKEKEVRTKKREIISLEYDEVLKLWNEMLRKNTKDSKINGKEGTYVYGIGAYALLFCCFTGLRWGEASCLCWEDIQEKDNHYYFKVEKQFITIKNRDKNIAQSYITIQDTPKSQKSNRYIPLSNKAMELLDMIKKRFPQYYKPDHLIFSTTNKPYNISTANRLLKAMCIRANIPIVSPHALRHSFASILLNEDEKNLYTVSDLLGHSSPDVTYKRYINIFEKNKINTVNIFDKLDED